MFRAMRSPIRPLPDEWPPSRRLEDLALRHWNLAVTCRAPECQRTVVFGSAQLWYRFHRRGWATDLDSVMRRLKCLRCYGTARSRGQLALDRTRDAPTIALPDPDMGEWKRMIARNRG